MWFQGLMGGWGGSWDDLQGVLMWFWGARGGVLGVLKRLGWSLG